MTQLSRLHVSLGYFPKDGFTLWYHGKCREHNKWTTRKISCQITINTSLNMKKKKEEDFDINKLIQSYE